MQNFFAKASLQDHPLLALEKFLEQEEAFETAKQYDKLRFVGYVLDIGYDTVTIITSDPFKINVGGVPRNSLLIMVPSVKVAGAAPHFTLLRVLETAPTPLSRDTQQTYFELQKKSMPELDVFTQSELQWGALQTGVLGMFYPHPDKSNVVEFSGDMNNFVSAHKYKVYAPNDQLLDLVVNAMVPQEHRFSLGALRLTECRLPLPGTELPNVSVLVSTEDFKGTRTAMFGKTRLGKSNVVKLIAQSLIETTEDKSVGQLIFDINGEYANDNPQDNNASLASAYPNRCTVYALSPKPATKSKPLKINFYEHPDQSHSILASLLAGSGLDNSIYIKAFLSVEIPSVESVGDLPFGERARAKRKILMYWASLHRAGFPANEIALIDALDFNPGFGEKALERVYGLKSNAPKISSLDDLAEMLEVFAEKNRESSTPLPSSTSGKSLFDADDIALLDFLKPKSSSSAGPKILQSFRPYHDQQAGDFVRDILARLDDGDTVILDLGNAPPSVMIYFSDYLSRAILQHQVGKFSNNDLRDHYMQLYFEEAHNLFPARDNEAIDIYRRLAKEGAKYHIGLVYSTQSVTTISKDLLAQTENFFIAHLSSQDEVIALAKVNTAYESLRDDILRAKTPGYMRMLTRSHRFVISTQARKFTPKIPRLDRTSVQPPVIPAGEM